MLKVAPSWVTILLAMLLGVLTGVLFGEQVRWLGWLGELFVALIRMVVMPVIFVSLVCAVGALEDVARLRRIACKTLAIYVATMLLAALLAMTLADWFGIGTGVALGRGGVAPAAAGLRFDDLLPANPVQAMAADKVLPVMLFALCFGVALRLSGPAGRPVALWFASLNQVIFRLVALVLKVAPLGVFALMARVAADNGLPTLAGLAALVGTLYLACLLLLTVVYGGILRLSGLDPWPFLHKLLPLQLFAFATCSSSASLPLALETAGRLGVKPSLASFVLPLGATVNMNGLAAYLGAVAVFAANASGVELSLLQKGIVLLTTTLGALGAAGVPGAGLVVMGLVLSSVGLPLEAVALVAAVDRLIDMINTPTNVSGDALAAVLVARSEGDLEHAAYLKREPAG